MVDPWSSMESSASPSTDSVPSVSTDDCGPSNQQSLSQINSQQNIVLNLSKNVTVNEKTGHTPSSSGCSSRNINVYTGNKQETNHNKLQTLSLNFEQLNLRDEFENVEVEGTKRRKPHFLDEDYQPPPRNHNEVCKIPKPHFLDQSPSPDDPIFADDDQIDRNVEIPLPPKRSVPPLEKISRQADKDKPHTSSQYFNNDTSESRSDRNHFRTHLHRGLEQPSTLAERDKRTTQLYHGTWPGERDLWPGGQDSVSVKSFSSAGSANAPHGISTSRQTHLGSKVDCVYSLLSLLSLSPDNNADMSDTLLEMSQTVDSCIAMRQSGCIPLLVQLVHSKLVRTTKDKAAQALYNIIHAQPDDKSGRREARVWRLLEQVREYCYILEDLIELRKECKEELKDDMTKHPGQSVAALMKLSFDEEHRHVMCQLGSLQALATLVSTDQESHGSLVEDSQCVTMRKYAGMALTNLTFGDGNNKALLCSFKDFMLALVDQLKSPNDDMRQVTAAVLRNLSWRADTTSKQILREVDAVKGLTLAAMACHKEATLKSVLSALWNLTAHCSLNKVDLCSVEGALGFLVDMLSFNAPSKTLAIIENSGGILRNVSSHIAVHEDYRQILRERNCLKVLLQHLKSPSLTVVSNSCGTLWNLSARCSEDQQYLWDHGAVPMLRSLIHSKHKMIAMGSSAALKNLLNSKPGKNHIVSLDSTARNMNLPVLPTLGARKQKAADQDIDQTLAETCDNIEPATSPTTNNRDEKNLYSATERQLSMNLDRQKNPTVMGLSPHQSILSTSNSILQSVQKTGHISRSVLIEQNDNVNRSESKDSVTSTHSDSVYERVTRNTQIPNNLRDDNISKLGNGSCRSSKPNISKSDRDFIKRYSKEGGFVRYNINKIDPSRNPSGIVRNDFSESGYDIDQDGCDHPVDYSQKYSETKIENPHDPILTVHSIQSKLIDDSSSKIINKESPASFGDYQETDLDQPTDYSLRYAEDHSENSSVISEPPGPSIHEDTIKYFCTEGTPYETPINFSTATSMSDLRTIGVGNIPQDNITRENRNVMPNVKVNSEIMTQSDEKDTCSIEDNSRHDNDVGANSLKESSGLSSVAPVTYESKFSSGMISPEKPVNYCEEGTPGYFSRVSSLSSLEEGVEATEESKNNVLVNSGHYAPLASTVGTTGRDKEGLKAVTFASDPVTLELQQITNDSGATVPMPNYAEETPLMFSRCSSLGSLSGYSVPDQGSVVSEFSRMTSGCISPSELPDSPGQSPVPPQLTTSSVPVSADEPSKQPSNLETNYQTVLKKEALATDSSQVCLRSVFEDAVSAFQVEHTPIEFSTATSLSSLTIDDDHCPKEDSRLKEVAVKSFIKQTSQTQQNVNDNNNHDSTTDGSSSVSDDGKSGGGSSDKEDDNILAACISAGMQSKIKTRIPTLSSPVKRNTGPISTSSPKTFSKSEVTHVFPEMQVMSDTCRTYFTEDTPAILSKAGSQSNLSVLSIETETDIQGDLRLVHCTTESDTVNMQNKSNMQSKNSDHGDEKIIDSSDDSSSLSAGSGNMLAECIRSGMPKGMQDYDINDCFRTNRKSLSERGEGNVKVEMGNYNMSVYSGHTGNIYRSDMGHETPPPPLPPKAALGVPPPPPPYPHHNQQKLDDLSTSNLDRNDSLSSLSIDSLGSTDGELLFQQCVRSGLPKPKPKQEDMHTKTLNKNLKARSAERSQETEQTLTKPHHKSLERGKTEQKSEKRTPRDPEFERLVAIGAYGMRTIDKMTRTDEDLRAKALLEEAIYSGMPKRKNKLANTQPNPSNESALNPVILQNKTVQSQVVDTTIRNVSNVAPIVTVKKQPDLQPLVLQCQNRTVQIADSGGYQCKASLTKNVQAPSAGAEAGHQVASCANADGEEKMLPHQDRTQIPLQQHSPALSLEVQRSTVRGDELEQPIIQRSGYKHTENSEDSQSSPHNYTDEPTVESPTDNDGKGCDTSDMTLSIDFKESLFDRSNEYPVLDCIDLLNYSLESEAKTDLNQSNESYAILLNQSGLSVDCDSDSKHHSKLDVDVPGVPLLDLNSAEIKCLKSSINSTMGSNTTLSNEVTSSKIFQDHSETSGDTWNDNSCTNDISIPGMSMSSMMPCSSKVDEIVNSHLLPGFLEDSLFGRNDFHLVTEKLFEGRKQAECSEVINVTESLSTTETSSTLSTVADAPVFVTNVHSNCLVQSVSSTNSLDLDNVKPPSIMDNIFSLSQTMSGYWNDNHSIISEREKSPQLLRKSLHKITRKKSLPVALMVKRALSNSMSNNGSTENLDCPLSLLDNVKPPSEMDYILDMEDSMASVASITSEGTKVNTIPLIFDLSQPMHALHISENLSLTHFSDLDHIEPPSLFGELNDQTLEADRGQSIVVQDGDDFTSNTLYQCSELQSGSENSSPLPSDYVNSSVESTPKKVRNVLKRRLTPKQKRQMVHDRFRTYVISDNGTEPIKDHISSTNSGDELNLDPKSKFVSSASGLKDLRTRVSPKQRRIEDRARYQTQTVDVRAINIYANQPPEIDSTKLETVLNCTEIKKTVRQKRIENADRFRTQTISGVSGDDIKNQQEIGGNEADSVLQTRLSAIAQECLEMNLRNIEASEVQITTGRPVTDDDHAGSSSDHSLDCDQNSGTESADQNHYSDAEQEVVQLKAKPKIVKPVANCRDESLDSNCSVGNEADSQPKAIRGRQKTVYVSPYRRNILPNKSPGTKITSSNKTLCIKANGLVSSNSSKRSLSQPTNRTNLTNGSQLKPTNFVSKNQNPHNKISKSSNTTKPLPLERQGTFTMEESTILSNKISALPVAPEKNSVHQMPKAAINTSPSRLPQPSRASLLKSPLRKTWSNETTPSRLSTSRQSTIPHNRVSIPAMRTSTSNQSLQSSDSSKGTTANPTSHCSGNVSVNSSNKVPKEITSRIASLWKKVEQKKAQPTKPDSRVWITNTGENEPQAQNTAKTNSSHIHTTKLIRSLTFDGPPKTQEEVSIPPKQKSSIAIKVSQIPSSRYSSKSAGKLQEKTTATNLTKKTSTSRSFLRKPLNQEIFT